VSRALMGWFCLMLGMVVVGSDVDFGLAKKSLENDQGMRSKLFIESSEFCLRPQLQKFHILRYDKQNKCWSLSSI
jgi:hypothetical protein